MTTHTNSPIHLTVGKGRAWKDLFVVVALAVVLGAFVAQITTGPRYVHLEPVTAAPAPALVHG